VAAAGLLVAGCVDTAEGQTGQPTISPDPAELRRDAPFTEAAPEVLFVPASRLMDARYREELGRTVKTPRPAERPPAGAELAGCELSCDAFVPRQPLVTVGWAPVLPARMPGADEPTAPELRLDIAATAGGFERAEFGTIPLRNVPKIKELPVSEIQLPERPEGQILLNMVRDGRVVERSASLPVFRSPEARTRAMASLPAEQVAEVEADLRLGGLNQIRVLGMTTDTVRGKPREAVSMLGLQPGMTYRIRVVDEAADGARTLAERVCRVPVCPADFVDSPQ
jgi:hypothetical protein